MRCGRDGQPVVAAAVVSLRTVLDPDSREPSRGRGAAGRPRQLGRVCRSPRTRRGTRSRAARRRPARPAPARSYSAASNAQGAQGASGDVVHRGAGRHRWPSPPGRPPGRSGTAGSGQGGGRGRSGGRGAGRAGRRRHRAADELRTGGRPGQSRRGPIRSSPEAKHVVHEHVSVAHDLQERRAAGRVPQVERCGWTCSGWRPHRTRCIPGTVAMRRSILTTSAPKVG